MKTIFIITFLFMLLVGITNADWYDTSYSSRVVSMFEDVNGSSDIIDYALNMTIETTGAFNNCDDIRVVNTSNVALEFWVEGECNNTETLIYAKAPLQVAGTTYTVEVYFNTVNASVPNEESPTQTFTFFADGDDASNWNVTHGVAAVRNLSGELNIDLSSNGLQNAVNRNLPNYTDGTQTYQWEGIFIENAPDNQIDLNIQLTGSIVTDRLVILFTRDNGVSNDVLAVNSSQILEAPYPDSQYNRFRLIVYETPRKVSYFMWNNDTNDLLGSFETLDYFTRININGTENLNLSDETGSESNTSWQYMRIRPYISPDHVVTTGTIQSNNDTIQECDGTTTEALNFTFIDENNRNQTFADFDVVFTTWTIDKDNATNSTFSFTNTTSEIFCIMSGTGELNVNATVQYQGPNSSVGGLNYPSREYFLINEVATTTTKFFDLYLLDDTLSTVTQVFIKNQAGVEQPGIIIEVQKFYFDINEWLTVTMASTDFEGLGVTGLVDSRTEDTGVFYRFILRSDETTILTTAGAKLLSDTTTEIISRVITIGRDVGEYLDVFLSVTATCTNSTTTISCTYIDNSGGKLTNVNLTINRLNVFVIEEVCSNTSSTPTGGTVICSIGNSPNGSYSFFLVANFDGGISNLVDSGSFIYELINPLGLMGLFVAFVIISSSAFVSVKQGPAPAIITMLAVMMITSYFKLLVLPMTLFGGIVISGLIIVVVISIKRR